MSPMVAERRNVLVYGGAMALAMVIMMLTLEDGVTRSEGVLMMVSYAVFVHDLYSNEGGEQITEEVIDERESPRRALAWILDGQVMSSWAAACW